VGDHSLDAQLIYLNLMVSRYSFLSFGLRTTKTEQGASRMTCSVIFLIDALAVRCQF
jgi:hypothetical protein